MDNNLGSKIAGKDFQTSEKRPKTTLKNCTIQFCIPCCFAVLVGHCFWTQQHHESSYCRRESRKNSWKDSWGEDWKNRGRNVKNSLQVFYHLRQRRSFFILPSSPVFCAEGRVSTYKDYRSEATMRWQKVVVRKIDYSPLASRRETVRRAC
jgi:hypothetical protein